MTASPYWIPKFLDDTGMTFFGWTISDIFLTLSITIGPPVLWIVYGQKLIETPLSFNFATVAIGLIAGGLIFSTKPTDYSVNEWITANLQQYFMRTHILYTTINPGNARETKDQPNEQEDHPDADPIRIWESNRRTQELTHVERIHVDDHVIERTDGAYIAALQISSVNLSLASNTRQQQVVNQFASMLNDNEYPFQIYVTTTPFAFDAHAKHYNERQTDRDIQERPILDELLYSYRTSTLESTGIQGTNQREYYLLIPVKPADIQTTTYTNPVRAKLNNIKNKLSHSPITRRIFTDDTLTKREQHDQQIKEIQRRIREIQRGIDSIGGCHSTRLNATHLAVLISEFWSGKNYDYDNPLDTDDGTAKPISTEAITQAKAPDRTNADPELYRTGPNSNSTQ